MNVVCALACACSLVLLGGCETFTPPVQTKNISGKSDAVTMNSNHRGVYFVWVNGGVDKNLPADVRKQLADLEQKVIAESGDGKSAAALLAKLNEIYTGERGIGRMYMVSEPPPDTALASTVKALAEISADIKSQSGTAKGQLDVTQSIIQIARATSVTLLRDTLFRLSEAYANGAIDGNQYKELHGKVVDSVKELAIQETAQQAQYAAQRASEAKIAEANAQSAASQAQAEVAKASAEKSKLQQQKLEALKGKSEEDLEKLSKLLGDIADK